MSSFSQFVIAVFIVAPVSAPQSAPAVVTDSANCSMVGSATVGCVNPSLKLLPAPKGPVYEP
ncbi:hypothetical protein ATK86_0926 [Nocardia fluminea]|uniref:Uncharacterized protein n=1 Tax=Nocardia fluminea TaxID=134984 RepID=A0A2N3WYF8_9NOCA|nr:hypothetical protein ATK86_0926 [Nocardia fluminea]